MDNLKQNNRRGEVIAQHFCMVKISCAQPTYTGLSSGVKSRDKWKRKQTEDWTKEQICKNLTFHI